LSDTIFSFSTRLRYFEDAEEEDEKLTSIELDIFMGINLYRYHSSGSLVGSG
jgi:hypothetical protein